MRILILSMICFVLLFCSFGCEDNITEPTNVYCNCECIISFIIQIADYGDTVEIPVPSESSAVTYWNGHINWSDSTFVVDSVWTEIPN